MSRVDLVGVSGRYGDFVALHPLDLAIREAEFLTLLGPSGCGKTTTLRLIAGFLRPTTGQIRFDDEDVTERPPNRRSIGMVFQDYALFPHMTVAENIAFGLRERRHERASIPVRVTELLELIQLAGLGERYPSELSGGQRQRVALARAVAHPPRVLLMDEPLGALDLKLREAMQVEVRRIQRELGITTVYVTHDQGEAMTMSDRIAVMNQGRVVQLATAETVYARPATRFVADFVGKINLLPVTVAGCRGEVTVLRFQDVELRAAGAGRPSAGDSSLALRPEHLRLTSVETAPSAENALPGTVEEIRFLGNVSHCMVRLDGGSRITVETAPGHPLASPGRTVRVEWDISAGAVLDE